MPSIGSITWIMLHTLAARIKEDAYRNNREQVLTFLKDVYRTYPCAYCFNDAMRYLSGYDAPLTTREDLKMYLFHFHTAVNIKLSKPYFAVGRLQLYENANVGAVFASFANRCAMPDETKAFLTDHAAWFNIP